MIKTHNIGYVIAGNRILDHINLAIKPEKLTIILGANGAGKSTLLQCLSGAITPHIGEVELDGKNLQHYSLKELATKRAVLSQSNLVNFPFSVTQIVEMGRSPYSNKNNDEAIITKALQLLDALHLKDRIFMTLSGGEQQRVQIARILTQIWQQEHAYIFLDEPTSALDLKHQHQLLQLLQELAQKKKFTIVTVMHDLHLAKKYGDEVIVLKEGKLLESGKIDEVLTANLIAKAYDIALEDVWF